MLPPCDAAKKDTCGGNLQFSSSEPPQGGRQPRGALGDAEGAGGAAVKGIKDGLHTGTDLGKAALDTGKNEVVNSFWDNAIDASNFVHNPLDQWPSGSAVRVALEPGPGPLINAGGDYAAGKEGPSAADTRFLKDHITGYAVTAGLQANGSINPGVGVNIPGIDVMANVLGQPRLADTGNQAAERQAWHRQHHLC